MIDLRIIREEPDMIRALCKRRGSNANIDGFLEHDAELRSIEGERNELRHQQKKAAGPSPEARAKAIELKGAIAALGPREAAAREARDAIWAIIPNLLPDDTPDGQDDQGNVEISTWGDKPTFDFKPKPHDELVRDLGILDFARGAKVAGSGFSYWVGDGARLAHGMFNLALDFLVERGFVQMMTPVVARTATLFGTGYLPLFADQVYGIEGEDLALIGTSEQTLVGFHANEILDEAAVPALYTSFSPCFRTEKGSHGRASRGAFRQHQFHKVEQVVLCTPETSDEWLEKAREHEEAFMQLLGIPYRLVRVCTGDLGAPAYKKYDIEGWFAGYGEYRETHSNSNLLDYQSRRLKIRVRRGKKKDFVHTISATMITDRALLAIIENNQLADGTVRIPEVLRPCVGGKEFLTPR